MKTEHKKPRFALCLQHGGNDDLVPRKFYETLPDRRAAVDGMLRVIDESGEDYLYPRDLFVFIELPRNPQRARATAA